MTNTEVEQYVSMDEVCGQARERGREDGKTAAGWVFDGNTPQRTYQLALELDEEGDPEFGDRFGARSPLSGEYSDDLTPAKLLEELGYEDLTSEEVDEVCSDYEQAYYDAHRDEVLRIASSMLES